MISEREQIWGVFTIVCLVSLLGLMEYQGMINLIADEDVKEVEEQSETVRTSS